MDVVDETEILAFIGPGRGLAEMCNHDVVVSLHEYTGL